MKGTPLNTLPKESVDAIVRSTERIEGAASILAMLEEKADGGRVTPSEIAAVRCVLESCGGAGRSLEPCITQSSSDLNPTLSRMRCSSI